MHERLRWGLLAASAASAPSQPDVELPSTPAAASFSQERREIPEARGKWLQRAIGYSPFNGSYPSLLAFPACVSRSVATTERETQASGTSGSGGTQGY